MNLLVAKGVSFSSEGRTILKEIDFSIDKGEIITLIGPNGGGKTTFARICLGLIAPTAGTIIRDLNLSIGYVPQKLKLDQTLPMTVKRFLMMGNKSQQKDGETALEAVEAQHLIDSQMSLLSGGELQRVLLARALVRKPDLLVLDEPAQGVDFSGEAALYELIGHIRADYGCAVLLISHDLHIVMGASDKVICLNGHVCCEGVPEQVSHHPEYERLFGREWAGAYGVYSHVHDHEHNLAGDFECCNNQETKAPHNG